MPRKYFQKFDGEITTAVQDYIDSWKEVIKPLEKKYNVSVSAFDPDIVVEDNISKASVVLPRWFAKRLLKP